jgi:hypothetical protein
VLFEDRAPLRFRQYARHYKRPWPRSTAAALPARFASPGPAIAANDRDLFARPLSAAPAWPGFPGQVRQREREVEGADYLPERLEVQSPDEADEAPLLRGVEPVAEVAAEVADRPDEPRLAGSRLLFYDAVKDCFKILNVLGKTGGRGRMLWRGFEKAHGSE